MVNFQLNLFNKFSNLLNTTMNMRRRGIALTNLSAGEVQQWVGSYDNVLFDCDGVLWVYDNIINGSVEVVQKLQDMGKNVYFVTNNSTRTRPEFVEKACRLKFNIKEENIISTAYLAAQYLKSLNFNKKVYLITSMGVAKELDAVGIQHIGTGPDVLTTPLANFVDNTLESDPDVGAVIVGFDEHFSFPKMVRAATYLNNPEILFVATNTDERFPTPTRVIPGTGSIVKAIETCAERNAVVMGKPSSIMGDLIIKQHNIDPVRTLMVGDRCNTDIIFGTNCGFQTLLVETGIHNTEDVSKWKANDNKEDKLLIPDFILPRLGDLLPYLLKMEKQL